MFHQLQIPQLIHLHLQGKFFCSPCRFPNVFCLARSMRKLLLLVSNGSSQLRVHPRDAEGWGYHSMKYPPLPGWDQSRDIRFCPILHTLCMQRISLNGLCTRTPAIQHSPQTEQDDGHSTCLPGGQRAQENYQHLCGTRGPPSRFPPIQPQPDQQLHPGHRCRPPGGVRHTQGRARRRQEACLLPLCGQSQQCYVHPNGPSLLSGVSHHLRQRCRAR